MKLRDTAPVAIAGGGIGGLACALALARRGFQVIVLEQATAFGEAGVGLQVAPNALAVLEALGVGADAKKNALLIERLVIKDSVTGDNIIEFLVGERFKERFGNPYAVAHRADIHGALLRGCQALRNIELRTNSRVLDFDDRDDGVSVTLASGQHIRAAALVGADGIRSRVRQRIVGDGEPLSAGALIYRALIPAAEMPRAEQKPYPTIWAGPGTHVIYYPVRDWEVFNFAVTVVTPDADVKGEGEATPEEAIKPILEGHETPLNIMRIPKRFNRYVIRHRHPVESWTRGPVTLLGDAAHPMVQYLAQGAAMALEDAICLAVAAEDAGGDFRAAFQNYQKVRIVRSARVQISSMMLDKLYHAGGVERLVRNSMFEGRSPDEYYDRLAWLYQSPDYVR